MEKHSKILNLTCRLCKSYIKITKGCKSKKKVVDFRDEVKRIFKYDIYNDMENQHPKFVCHVCCSKLRNIKPSQSYEDTRIAEFDVHKNESCFCTKSYLRKSNEFLHRFSMVKRKEFNLGDVEIAAKENNFFPIMSTEETLIVMKYDNEKNSFLNVSVQKDLTWKIYNFKTEVPLGMCSILGPPIESILTEINVDNFFKILFNFIICCGNNDFEDLVKHKMERDFTFKNKAGKDIAYVQTYSHENLGNCYKTIRTIYCEYLIEKTKPRCDSCANYRNNLRKLNSRIDPLKGSAVKSRRPHSSLNKKQLRKRLFTVSKEKKSVKKKIKYLEQKVQLLVKKEGVEVDNNINDILEEVSKSSTDLPENSVMRLLWKQQKKAASFTNKTSMRWHPMTIRWCLSIFLRSPGTYEHLQRTGFLQLPHRTTLNQYAGFLSEGSGFKVDIIQHFLDEIKADKIKQHQLQCALLFDEMSIKSGLVYSGHTHKLIGFTELGSINEEIDALEKQVTNKTQESKELATHVLALMVRGLTASFCYPIAYYPTTNVDSYQLVHIIWEAIMILEMVGVHVRALVCDGASQNRKFFHLHEMEDGENKSEDGAIYWVYNRYGESRRKIFFIRDPPHLMKTLRNNLENSSSNSKTRNLMIGGEEITWQHIRNLYEWDLNMNSFCPGLRKLHKLTADHVNLGPRTRMRVNLAVQVLSKSVADAMKVQNYSTTKSTEKFIRLTDTFFDCLNVQNVYIGQKKRKKALEPYKSPDDWRFKFLTEEFLKFFNDWKDEVDNLEGIGTARKMQHCISYQTLDGIRMTVHSFVELVPILLNMEGVDYILSEKLNQDPLEEHFGKHRSKLGGSDNPTIQQYMQSEKKIVVAKSTMLTSLRGNTRGKLHEPPKMQVEDEQPLKKRKK